MNAVSFEGAEIERFYWEGLSEKELRFQHCLACGHRWLPPSEECPLCLGSEWEIQKASGAARLISWVIYHVPPHPDFTDLVPYNVALVELDEGPRTITNLTGVDDWESIAPEKKLELTWETYEETPLARFRVAR